MSAVITQRLVDLARALLLLRQRTVTLGTRMTFEALRQIRLSRDMVEIASFFERGTGKGVRSKQFRQRY